MTKRSRSSSRGLPVGVGHESVDTDAGQPSVTHRPIRHPGLVVPDTPVDLRRGLYGGACGAVANAPAARSYRSLFVSSGCFWARWGWPDVAGLGCRFWGWSGVAELKSR